MRDLLITPALNGYIVVAGCQKLVFTNSGSLLNALGAYLSNPDAVEKKFIDEAVNPMKNPVVREEIPCPPPYDGLGNSVGSSPCTR